MRAAVDDGAQELIARLLLGRLAHSDVGLHQRWVTEQHALLLSARDGGVEPLAHIDELALSFDVLKPAVAHHDEVALPPLHLLDRVDHSRRLRYARRGEFVQHRLPLIVMRRHHEDAPVIRSRIAPQEVLHDETRHKSCLPLHKLEPLAHRFCWPLQLQKNKSVGRLESLEQPRVGRRSSELSPTIHEFELRHAAAGDAAGDAVTWAAPAMACLVPCILEHLLGEKGEVVGHTVVLFECEADGARAVGCRRCCSSVRRRHAKPAQQRPMRRRRALDNVRVGRVHVLEDRSHLARVADHDQSARARPSCRSRGIVALE